MTMSEMVTCERARWVALLCAAVLVGCGGSSNRDRDAGDAQAPLDVRADAQSDGGAGAAGATDTSSDRPPDSPTADAAGSDASAMSSESYVAALSGAQEVPSFVTSATGAATFTYAPATRSLSWTLTHDVTTATAAAIYTGGAGEAGSAPIALATSSPSSGMATLTSLQEADLRLGHLNINVQSGAAPGGEIRGQILRPGETLWVARLNGPEETPPTTTATGTAAFSLIVNSAHTSGHYRVTTSVIPLVGHIHPGLAGIAGDPLITMTFVGSTAEADIPFDDATFQALDQAGLYANVHTVDSLTGPIRGQILRPGERLFVALMSGANEVPATTTTATGAVQFVLDYSATTVRYRSQITGLADATSALVLQAPVGMAGPQIATLTLIGLNPSGTWAVTLTDVDNLRASLYYLDIRSTAHPSGEIRGQITPR
jgi:hypothetical protein